MNGQILIDNFNSPPLPPVGYGPTPAFSAKFSAKAGTPYSVELDYHRVPGFFGNAYGGRTGRTERGFARRTTELGISASTTEFCQV